jgi:N-acyl-D-amino-acid deacylase
VSEVFAIAEALTQRAKGTIAITIGPDFFVDEMARLSEVTGRPVTWTALGSGNPDVDPLEVLERHRRAGGEVYPQVACRPVVMQAILSEPAQFSYVDAFRDVLAAPPGQRRSFYEDEAWRQRARRDFQPYDHFWARITVDETTRHPELVGGPSLAELGVARGVHPLDVLCDLSLEEDLSTRFRTVLFNDDEVQLAELLRADDTLLGLSDAGAHVGQLCDAVFSTYLLEHWVRETGVLTLEKAVWRLTQHPAQVYRITDRGRIQAGLAADLVAFDPDRIAVSPLERVWDLPAGADRLVARSQGIEGTWVNGVAAGSPGPGADGARGGRLLRV